MLLIILTLIFCDCDETTKTTQTYNVEGAYKTVDTHEHVDETQRETTEKNVTQYNQQKFKMEQVNDLALEMQKNMSNGDISDFIQKQMAAKNSNSESAKKLKIYESNLDKFLSDYLETHQTEMVTQNGNIHITKKIMFMKDNREIFYDPQLMNVLWAKTSILIERNELSEDSQVYQLLDPEFLKDDIVDFISVIKKSTWFVFKFSRFMPFWLETLSYITDTEFLSAATKDELIYLHLYTKKMFRIFTRVLVGNKTKRNVKYFFLFFAQVIQELAEYEFSVNLLFKHIQPDTKNDFKDDFQNLLVNQTKILETLKYIKENKYMEAIDVSLSDEMQKLDDMMTKMRKGVELSLGDIEVTTIIKTKIIDIKKKIMKKISLILKGSMLEKFRKTSYYSHLVRILKALQDVLNSHIMDNDENIEIILESLDLFLIKLEEYLNSIVTNDSSYTVNKELHSQLMSSVAFFISKVETAHSLKTQETKKQYTMFLLRVQLFLLALEKPSLDNDVVYDFDDSEGQINPFGDLPQNLDDLFGEYESLDDDPQVKDSFDGLKKNGERTIYLIDRNIDLSDRPVNTEMQKYFNQFKKVVQQMASDNTMLKPFYTRMLEIFTESEKSLSIIMTMDYLTKLQNLTINLRKIKEAQEDFAEEQNPDGSRLGQVVYAYKTYREAIHKEVPELVRHLTYVCSQCDPQVLARIGNQMTSHKDSLVDVLAASNRLTLLNDSLATNDQRVVYVVEVLDCENSNIFVKLIQKKDRRLI